jgi:selenocysteine-specific elongation factor
MIIGMAGHVDHGKSALVTALTGQAMDRLAEERRRGITIDLNFAPLKLSSGATAGIIDVPGHEDLVRTMVAGASGIDVAVLVIAADEGVMPQTREHLLVLEQLRVPAAVAVLTRVDTVEPEWLELMQAEVEEWLASSSLGFGRPILTSVVTGQGIPELRTQLTELGRGHRRREDPDLFRLPIDRVFTVAGAGTVVTGTAISGAIAVGDTVRILPSGGDARVRSIESHGVALQRSAPGTRTALALSGPERDDIGRGDVVVLSSDDWRVTTRLDIELSLGRETAALLEDRSRVRVHLGTSEVMARIRLDAPLAPGTTALARLDLEEPVLARGDDRLVLRSFSPVAVIGGGRVVDPLPGSRRRTPAGIAALDPESRLEAMVGRRRHGVEVGLLPQLLGMPPVACAALLDRSSSVDMAGGLAVLRDDVRRLALRLEETVARYHRESPHEPGMSVETLRHSLSVPDQIAEAALAAAVKTGRLVIGAGRAAAKAFRSQPRVADADRNRIVEAVRQGGLMAPGAAELAHQLDIPAAEAVLREAVQQGDVVQVEPGRYLSREALEEFRLVLREVGSAGQITPGAIRDRTGLSRKYLIPLLEWADRTGLTRREGDGRRLCNPAPARAQGA